MRKLLAAAIALLSFSQAVAGPVCPRPDLRMNISLDQPWTRKECPRVCISNYSPGGNVELFKNSAYLLRNQGRLLIINGECTSACTIAADLARPNVCITPRAVFRFHKSYVWDTKGCFLRREDLSDEYSTDIRHWVKAHGGFPGNTLQDDALLDMSNQQAQQFFPVCGGAG